MNLKNLSTIFALTIAVLATNAQETNILTAEEPADIGVRTDEQIAYDNDHPLEYGYVDERDVLWGKTTWEKVDLDERVNFPLYYPIDTNNIGTSRRSLYDVLMNSIKGGKISNIYSDSYFTEKRTLKDIQSSLKLVDTTDLGIEQMNAGEVVDAQYVNVREISSADISEYHIRGYWYFDKRQGELRYRLLGLAPVAPDVNFIDDDEPDMVPLFWIYRR